MALPLPPFLGSIPPLGACNLCSRQEQRAFSSYQGQFIVTAEENTIWLGLTFS